MARGCAPIGCATIALLAGIVGAGTLAKKQLDTTDLEKESQRYELQATATCGQDLALQHWHLQWSQYGGAGRTSVQWYRGDSTALCMVYPTEHTVTKHGASRR